MTRRPWAALAGVLVLAAGSMAWLVLTAEDDGGAQPPSSERVSGLTLLVVKIDEASFGAVVGSTGGAHGALVLPTEIEVTIPGQGDATLGDALDLPPRQAATTVANVLGVWVDHHVVFDGEGLAALVERAGGIAVGSDTKRGREVVAMLEDTGGGAGSAFSLVLSGLLADIEWEPSILADADSASSVAETLEAAREANVSTIPVVQAAKGIFVSEPEAVRQAVVDAFGGPDREVVRVIVLNGSGLPGVGELVAERIVPGGFRIVVSENAANFDHDETLVVVGSADDVVLGERVRDLLGTGSVNVSVSSGIAPVTVVVGKDFTG
jgi:LytR cell envelope-related transcriptional attenuator